MKILELLYVGVGGALGAIIRYLITNFVKNQMEKPGSFATFSINIIGTLLLGFSMSVFPLDDLERLFFCSGFVSSFTTFSTFIAEIHEMHTKKQYILNILYIVLSVVFGFIAILISIRVRIPA